MGIQQRCLTTIFRTIQPEVLYDQMRSSGIQSRFSSSNIPSDVFQATAPELFPGYSHEELENILGLVRNKMSTLPDGTDAPSSVFNLLLWMGHRVLRIDSTSITYNFSEALAWLNVYQKLGQDLFTTAYLAYEDWKRGTVVRDSFTWEAIIKSDNIRLNALLNQGLTENHCHLGGTTQNFPLSWVCLMNFPQTTIGKACKILKMNLQPAVNRGSWNNVWPWKRRLLWAAFLRMRLFETLEGIQSNGSIDMNSLFDPQSSIDISVNALRTQYGLSVPVKNSYPFVLDYALRRCDSQGGLAESPFRLLSGERSFLYRCFYACFSGEFDSELQNWFYMYLLLKENFRSEIIQVNGRPGFYNFKEYQDRKDLIFDRFPGYKAEAIRLSVNASYSSQHILSFEARIAPKNTAKEMRRQINQIENYIDDANNIKSGFNFFYVYHFIKSPEEKYFRPIKPRNSYPRKKIERQAKAIAGLLGRSQPMCDKVLGIDAANLEVYCRPEVFASAYRYLSDLEFYHNSNSFLGGSAFPHLHRTYHVGEDFLDIADGLRAIDEAVYFLGLKRGDRLGHALALGVDPFTHYGFKTRRIVLPKQNLLDNLVWILYRSQDINVSIDTDLRFKLQKQAEDLLNELYGSFIKRKEFGYVDLRQYFCAMHLRGDSPELYKWLPYAPESQFYMSSFEKYYENPDSKLKAYREDPVISSLYQAYHFDHDVRVEGGKIKEFIVDDKYIHLMAEMQDKMQCFIAEKGLMIECNPTSNYLIGTFRRYDKHPIFRFNNVELLKKDGIPLSSPQISVSINTDDLGVFDTSLENEYAILAAALERDVDENGEEKYFVESIYKYLDNVRKMGIQQSFLTQVK